MAFDANQFPRFNLVECMEMESHCDIDPMTSGDNRLAGNWQVPEEDHQGGIVGVLQIIHHKQYAMLREGTSYDNVPIFNTGGSCNSWQLKDLGERTIDPVEICKGRVACCGPRRK